MSAFRLSSRSLETGGRLLLADNRLSCRIEINLARCQIRFEAIQLLMLTIT